MEDGVWGDLAGGIEGWVKGFAGGEWGWDEGRTNTSGHRLIKNVTSSCIRMS